MQTTFYEGISFNCENVAGKTKVKFIEEMMPTKNYRAFDDKERRKLFEKAWELCKKTVTDNQK